MDKRTSLANLKPPEAEGLGVSPSLPLRGVWWGYRLVRREVAYG